MCDMLVAAILALFGAVYESFSFGVFSFSMIYAFSPFFVLALSELALSFFARFAYDRPGLYLFRWAACSASAGMVVKGILDIYGTSSDFYIVYPLFAGSFFLLGAARLIYRFFIKKESRETE